MKAIPKYPAPKKLVQAKTKSKNFNYGSMKNIVAPEAKKKFLDVDSIIEEPGELDFTPENSGAIPKNDFIAQVRDFHNMKDL